MTDPSHLIGVSDRPKWPGSRKTPREAGKRGPNSLVVAKGAQRLAGPGCGDAELSKLRGEKIRITMNQPVLIWKVGDFFFRGSS